jgi:hypothetical protein
MFPEDMLSLIVVGTLATLASSAANITALFIMKGMEPAFVCLNLSRTDIQICLTCCSVDISFSVLVLHWITSVQREDRTVSPPAIECPIHGTNAVDCCLNSRPTNVRCTDQQIFRRARLRAKSSFQKITDQIRSNSKGVSNGSAKPSTPPEENLVVVSYEVWTTVEETMPTGETSNNIAGNNTAGETADNSDLQNCK